MMEEDGVQDEIVRDGESSVAVCVVVGSSKSGNKNGAPLVAVGVAVQEERGRSDLGEKQDGVLTVHEFVDCDALTNLESMLVGIEVERIRAVHYFQADQRQLGVLESLLGEKGLHLAKRQRIGSGDIKTDNTGRDLGFLTGSNFMGDIRRIEGESGQGLRAVAGLIAKEGLLEDDEFEGRFVVEPGRLDQFMRLDAAAVLALNLFPEAEVQAKESSLFGVLNHCVTKQLGSRLLKRWIRQPLQDLKEIEKRQALVAGLKVDTTRRSELRQQLKQVPDVTKHTKKLRGEKSRGGLKDLYVLYEFVRRLPALAESIKSDSSGEAEALADLKALGEKIDSMCAPKRFQKYKQLIEGVLDMELAPKEFRVQPKHDETGELSRLAGEIEELEDEVDSLRNNLMNKELHSLDAKFETDPAMLKTYGYHFRINKKHDATLSKLKGENYKYLNVVAAGIRWTTSQLKDLHQQHVELISRYNEKQHDLVMKAVEVAATFEPLFEAASSIAAQLDVLASLAHAAAYAPVDYVQPKMVGLGESEDKRIIKLEKARHPCLEHLENVDFIANNYQMTGKSKSEGKFQIITGPNMGGKSTYIRQLGVILVMAQIGSFVPCEHAELPVVDSILARVGASDEQLRGVSTFMAEMLDAAAIVKTATKDSLVIIDELGRGTSTYDGFGLAWAISEHLASNLKPFGLFATHFHELTALEDHLEEGKVSNRHVQALATEDTITMLYNVNDGPCEESFGINIAKMAGFPEPVIAGAKRKLSELESLNTKVDVQAAISKVRKFANLSLQDALALKSL